jgi:hypothetical protein
MWLTIFFSEFSDIKKLTMDNQSPPFFKTWKGFYLFVVGFLALLVIIFQLITSYYKP